MVADIDLPALATGDVAVNYPGITEALLRLHTAYREEQLALADRGVERDDAAEAPDPVAESRRFLGARRNSFPLLDDAGEKLAPLPGSLVRTRSEEHTSELQSLMRISSAVFCLKKKNSTKKTTLRHTALT